ncbi:hypothetical protein FJZ33_04010 [Candidatus Poribacteria bacterium]|nr:hypothetical protein [Candidatus Poribacteria bacterium]
MKTQLNKKANHEIEFKINMSLNDLIIAIKNLDSDDREFIIENLLGLLSSEYLESIEEARRDYKEGRIVSHEEAWK